jgi:hypothetical protein
MCCATRSLAALLVAGLLATPAYSQTPGTAAWSGWVQCRVEVQAPGYTNRQTHSWEITGAPSAGGIPEYPATWTVVEDATADPQRAVNGTRPTNASLASARIAIFTRASDNRLVALLRNGQLSVRGGTTGTPTASAASTLSPPQSVGYPIYEWRPLPSIEDVVTSSHMTGTGSMPVTTRLNPLQPANATGQAVCRWDFVRGGPAAPLPQPNELVRTGGGAAPPATSLANPSITPAAVGCDADTPNVACNVGALRPGQSITSSANFHIASDVVDWFATTAYAGSAAFAKLDLQITGGSTDGQYAIEVSEGALQAPIVLGASSASHAPALTVGWASASAASKSLRIKVTRVGGAPSNDVYTLRMSMSESATAPPANVTRLAPQVVTANAPAATQTSNGQAAPPASSSGPKAAGCDANTPVEACKMGVIRPGQILTSSGNLHGVGDVVDWFAATAYAGAAPFATLDVQLTGGTSDGVYAIEVSEGPLQATVVLGVSSASHTPAVSFSWASASASSKFVRIKVSHVSGAPGDDVYTLRLTMSESTSQPRVNVPSIPQR